MAYSRFLLLLIGALSWVLPKTEARPVDFWCTPEIREAWRESADTMIQKMVDCQGTDNIKPTSIQCPFVGVNTQRWDNMTVLEKYADVMNDLQVFHDGLEEATNQTTSKCQALLPDITQHIGNNRVILQRQIQNSTMAAVSSPLQTCSGLTELLRRYQRLLQGKLEMFVDSYKDSICDKHKTE